MAVHPDLPGIEVSVCVDSSPLTEYDTENDDIEHDDATPIRAILHQQKWTVTKYVTSTTGKAFTIKLSVQKPYMLDAPQLAFEVLVDAKWMDEPLMAKGRDAWGPKKGWTWEVKGLEQFVGDGMAVVKPMIFAEIQKTSEKLKKADIDQQKDDMSGIGEIEVRVSRRSQGKPIDDPARTYEENNYNTKIHEKVLAKESQSHGTILGKPHTTSPSQCWDTDFIDYPIAVFVFKYRSEDALRSLCVLNHSPTPVPEATGPATGPATMPVTVSLAAPAEAPIAVSVAGSVEIERPLVGSVEAPVAGPVERPMPGPAHAPTISLTNLSQAEKNHFIEQFFQSLAAGGSPIKNEGTAVKTEGIMEIGSTPVKRELNDGDAPTGPRKKPKKMIGKVTIDLTEDEDEPSGLVIELD